jgi:hypothetical protein
MAPWLPRTKLLPALRCDTLRLHNCFRKTSFRVTRWLAMLSLTFLLSFRVEVPWSLRVTFGSSSQLLELFREIVHIFTAHSSVNTVLSHKVGTFRAACFDSTCWTLVLVLSFSFLSHPLPITHRLSWMDPLTLGTLKILRSFLMNSSLVKSLDRRNTGGAKIL